MGAKKEIVLTAGAVGSPQLLMLSGVGPKDHLDKLKVCHTLGYIKLTCVFCFCQCKFILKKSFAMMYCKCSPITLNHLEKKDFY